MNDDEEIVKGFWSFAEKKSCKLFIRIFLLHGKANLLNPFYTIFIFLAKLWNRDDGSSKLSVRYFHWNIISQLRLGRTSTSALTCPLKRDETFISMNQKAFHFSRLPFSYSTKWDQFFIFSVHQKVISKGNVKEKGKRKTFHFCAMLYEPGRHSRTCQKSYCSLFTSFHSLCIVQKAQR